LLERTAARVGAFLLAFGLLLPAGCKKKESPPPTPREHSAIISTQEALGSPFSMSLSMDPAQPKSGGKTDFRVTIKQKPGTVVDGAQVQASLVMPLMDMGKNQFPLQSAGNGEYEGKGEFTMAGEWEVVVTANAQGKTGKTTFNVNVAQ
jgi:YtkA-like